MICKRATYSDSDLQIQKLSNTTKKCAAELASL